jgi:predicted SnoaL-like aldol condensation-catalyzing enzyme
MVQKDLMAIDTYVGPEFHQHDPSFADGVAELKAGLAAYLEQFPEATVTPRRVVAGGDLVAVHSHLVPAAGERGHATIDLFRVRDSKMVEHW